ncbi:ribosomal protein S18 acetylase RimI-like enzyme [Flavobacterium sp. 28YEA47A]|uniref:GNAT family N-acetyltransferase n=1 Tax=Flavobacterium sp. 28YEA47A TaxID=3156276 RepID=UPI00351608D6
MTQFQTLEKSNTKDLLDVFNSSFSDYIVPFHLTLPQLEAKITNDSIHTDLSVGAFERDKLIGFILHGYDTINGKSFAYNAGTGIIPEKRGHGLTAKLYDYILPLLKAKNTDSITLEVLTGNVPALKTYEKIGFKTVRYLDCYKGLFPLENHSKDYEIRTIQSYNWQSIKLFWDWEPSWQNSITAVENLKETNHSIGIFDGEQLLGYLIYNPLSKRIQQFGIKKEYRRKGLGKQLFNYIATTFGNEMSLINVDGNSKETASFLASLGFEKYIVQHEMELKLK